MSRELLGVPRERVRSVPDEDVPAEPELMLPTESSGDIQQSDEQRVDVETETPSLVDNVRNAIPVEVVTGWAIIDSVLSSGGTGFADVYWNALVVVCVATALHVWTNVETPTQAMAEKLNVPFAYLKHSQYAQILLGVVAFLVWAYTLGEPFWTPKDAPIPYKHVYASVAMALYVVLGPKLIPDLLRKVHGVDVPDERQRAPDEFAETEDETVGTEEGIEPSES